MAVEMHMVVGLWWLPIIIVKNGDYTLEAGNGNTNLRMVYMHGFESLCEGCGVQFMCKSTIE